MAAQELFAGEATRLRICYTLRLTLEQQWLRGATTCPVCRQRVRGPQSARRDRGAQADPQPGSSRVAAAFDIVREIREQVRMALPDPATGASRSEAGPSGGRSQVERELDQEESMPFGW